MLANGGPEKDFWHKQSCMAQRQKPSRSMSFTLAVEKPNTHRFGKCARANGMSRANNICRVCGNFSILPARRIHSTYSFWAQICVEIQITHTTGNMNTKMMMDFRGRHDYQIILWFAVYSFHSFSPGMAQLQFFSAGVESL